MDGAAPLTEGILNHVRRDSLVNRRFVFPGDEVNTGKFEPHRVAIRNARIANPRPTLATHGFELFQHKSAVRNFADVAEIDAIYPGEIVEAIKSITGADLVVTIGATLRTSADTSSGAKQPPAAEGKRYRRSLVTSLWRTYSPAPQDWPLALCDGNSIAPEEGVHNYLVRTPSRPTPEEMSAPIEGEEDLPSALIFRHGPHHRWYYYP